jgi:hypothetical protein
MLTKRENLLKDPQGNRFYIFAPQQQKSNVAITLIVITIIC